MAPVTVDGGVDGTTLVSSSGRRGDIQGLRALAVILVVVYHSGVGLPGGYIGVDVFFVISGYVITRALIAELSASGRLDLKRFYLRRIRRLLPALGVMLSVVMLASVLLASSGGQQVTGRTGAAAALFNANTYLMRLGEGGYFDVSADVNALLHTWSLSVEEQFYLVFPALLFGAWLLGRKMERLASARVVTITLALITVVSFAISWALTNGHTSVFGKDAIDDLASEIAFYSAPTRAWQFAVGGLLVFVAPRLINLGKLITTMMAFSGVVFIGFAAVAFDSQTPFPGTAALLPTIGALLILAAGEAPGGNPVNQVIAVRPAQYLGDLSYSWYLWHWPCIVFAAALWPGTAHTGLSAAAISLLPAWLSYQFVESPIRFAPLPKATRTIALATACIALPLFSSFILESSHRFIDQTETVTDFQNPFRYHADAVRDCGSSVPLGDRTDSDCTWEVDEPIGQAVLVGDSNAGHFTEAFTTAANAENMTAVVATKASCPFIDLVLVRNGRRNDECRRFVTELEQFLIQARPGIVLLSSSASFIETEQYVLESPAGDERFVTADEKAAAWTEALRRTVDELQSAGIEVLLVQTVPKFEDWDPRGCAVARVLLSPSSCGVSRPLTEADTARGRSIMAVTAVAEATNAPMLDVANELCPQGICSTYLDGTWMWRDGSHISVDASEQLAPIFGEFLQEES